MHQYGVRDIEKLLGLPRSTIRALIGAGFVTPARGPRNAWLFSFQDLIVLRTAQALSASLVPNRRITKSLKELRRNLPEEMPLSGLRIAAVGDRVVVKEGDTRWQAEGGQYLLAFEGDPAAGSLNVVERMPSRPKPRHRAERAPDADDALSTTTRTRRSTRIGARSSPSHRGSMHAPTSGVCCTKAVASRKPSRSIAKRSTAAATMRCCSTTSACCSTTWIARSRRWRRTSSR